MMAVITAGIANLPVDSLLSANNDNIAGPLIAD